MKNHRNKIIQKQDNLVITYEKKAIIKEDLLGKNNCIELYNTDYGHRQFHFSETYFSKDRILNGIFSQSPNGKYLAFGCVNFFKIWDLNEFKNQIKISEKNCIVSYDIHNQQEKRDESDKEKNCIKHLIFSGCSDYLIITGWLNFDFGSEGDIFCFICDLKSKAIVDLRNIIEHNDTINSVAFSHNNKYLAVASQFDVYIFKKRENGFE